MKNILLFFSGFCLGNANAVSVPDVKKVLAVVGISILLSIFIYDKLKATK